jgi:p-hydroxybenzoate 3-monooxygenase
MPDDGALQAEVCVVGAGPAGLVVALLLQQSQIPCVLLERLSREAFRRVAGAGLIEDRTVRALESHGLAEPIFAHGGTNSVCEFRFEGQSFVLDYGALTGGRGNYIYPQHELVAAFAERFVADGGEIRFGVRAFKVEQDGDGATISAVDTESGDQVQVRCRFVAGCDGARSELLEAIENASVIELKHPFRWLTLIAAAAPSKPRTLYGFHRRGFAGQMQRGPALTRFMLQIARADTIDEWPDERIWAELRQRLHANGEPELTQGPLVERDVLDLRVRVIEPMQHQRLYLAGDAGHLITPAGGKGMNLAILDAIELGLALGEKYTEDPRGKRLADYSNTRLPAIWRTQEFSNWMLTLLHANVGRSAPTDSTRHSDEPSEFAYRLRRARLEELMSNRHLSRWFAHAYAGVDPEAPPSRQHTQASPKEQIPTRG